MDTLQISADSPHCCEVPHLQKPAGGHHHVPCQQFAEVMLPTNGKSTILRIYTVIFFGGVLFWGNLKHIHDNKQ